MEVAEGAGWAEVEQEMKEDTKTKSPQITESEEACEDDAKECWTWPCTLTTLTLNTPGWIS